MGDQGVRQMALIRWARGKDTRPQGVVGVGGRLGYEDAGNTFNTNSVSTARVPKLPHINLLRS